ncbi:hypothetical protein [Ralstonia phage RSP15]|uniref:hypothetical protein n=1 Tax=Ralstonia phage RSP15 TaxID=1785960 RepID=UPI00074D3E0D|nr:hypothetical protein BH754_gp159 [Ralstonia phage RSP15]BAU40147.1 hypothetical protein [Ralstonia phage RSP15]
MEKVLYTIWALRETTSSKEKIAILKAGDSEDLRNYLRLVYDNKAANFYITEVDLMFADAETQELGLDRYFYKFQELGDMLNSRFLSGHRARQAIANFYVQSDAVGKELLKLMLARDIKAGVSAKTINKAFPGLIPLASYMRCSLPKAVKLDQWDWDRGVYLQTKEDAMFANMYIGNGEITAITSRVGTRYPLDRFKVYFSERFNSNANYVIHGELIVYEDGKPLPREKSNGVMNSVEQGESFAPNQYPVFVAWDIIPQCHADTGELYEVEYEERFLFLQTTIYGKNKRHIRVCDTEIVYSLAEAKQKTAEKMARGLEGSIIKRHDGFWKDGDSKDQVKLKQEKALDLVVTGINPGNGKNADTFGSLIMQTSCGRLECGLSGFTDKMRAQIHALGEGINGVVMEVIANGIMYSTDPNKPHSLFLPRFSRIRTDKNIPDSFERVEEIFAEF